MCDVVKVCAVCKKEIEIDINNIHSIARVNGDYYHPECLIGKAEKCLKRARHNKCWDYVIGHISECEQDAKEVIYKRYWQDKLNEHLLRYYDIVAFPNRFWEMIMDLNSGIYKGKKCRAVNMETLYGAWVWGQRKLDDISRRNKTQHKGPKNDAARLNYDLSILLGHIGDYEKYLAKTKAEEEEKKAKEKENINIDYSKVQAKKETSGLGDISNLIDDLI